MRHYEVWSFSTPVSTNVPSHRHWTHSSTSSVPLADPFERWTSGSASVGIRNREEARGYLRGTQLNAEPDAVKELDRQLSLQDSVLRTKVLRREVAA